MRTYYRLRHKKEEVKGHRTASEFRAWLVSYLSATSDPTRQQIDVRESFRNYGLDSLGAIRMIAELSRQLGRSLSPTLVWEHPTIEGLASYLAGERAAPAELEEGVDGTEVRDEQAPIAIVGMACRFPGAPDVAAFWRLLCDGVCAVSEVPADRGWGELLLADGIDPEERAKVRRGAFLERIDGFDPFFFGISPREAMAMDPQQRLMLELSWEALEDAGARPSSLRGSATGVFAGAIWSDYGALVYRGAPDGLGQFACTGVHRSIIANRISYALGLEGPSLALDAACSSGLVAVHLACESLRRGESSVALAGAVNLNVLPESALAVSRFGALSPDGRCYTFDARANGYVRGEGGGVVVLKRLSRAIADRDPIRAVIRGAAVNNDGASNGLTAPSSAAQEAVLRRAYRRAGVRPEEVQYVEAHGTGTPLGDPIEARALSAVLGAGRPAEAPLLVGSAKTNVGHLEGAAGLVGLIKVALAIEHRVVPASLHFESSNPHAPLAELGLAVPTAAQGWPAPERPLMAGVSSFGLGGTNSHVVVQEWLAPVPAEPTHFGAASGPKARAPSEPTHDGAASGPKPRAPKEPGRAAMEAPGGVVFVFPGQGAQWPGMARGLLQSEPVFRATIEACDRHIRRFMGWSLVAELLAPERASRLGEIEVSLPAIISIDVAIAAWWRSLGVEPAAVVGHSTGEIAAAHVAGALDLEDTMRIICAYGRFVGRFAGQSGMAFVGLPWDEAAGALAGFEGRVFRAIEDSAAGTVVAGTPTALDELLAALGARGVFCRAVSMNVGPHSPLVAPVRDELFEALRGIRPRRGRIPLISEVVGAELDGAELDAAHWVRNFGDPAFFSRAIDALIGRGHRVFVDVGPHPITAHSIETNLRRAGAAPGSPGGGVVLPSLRRGEDGRRVLLETAAALYRRGAPIRWEELAPTGHDASEVGAAAWLIPVSARSEAALAALAGAYAEAIRPGARPARLADVAYTAAVRRDHHPHRVAVVGRTRTELAEGLAAASRGERAGGVARGPRPPAGAPRVVFVFPGQGSQWVGMGRTLLAEEPVFRAAIEACDEAIAREAGFSVLEELAADAARSRLADVAVVQPTLFAVEVALAALWRSWGVVPDAVVGHSMGEIAAAQVAGILSTEDAVRVVCRRSALMRRVSGRGAMALVELAEDAARAAIAWAFDRLSVAAINGPRATVLSGDPAALEEVTAGLVMQGVFCQRVKVDVASHSTQMEPLLPELRAALRELAPVAGVIAMLSTVTAAAAFGPELSAAYWTANLREPVRFAQAIEALGAAGPTIFVEVSPHPILAPAIEETLRERGLPGAVVPSLRRETDERRAMLEALGEVWVSGRDVALDALFPEGGRVVALPGYAWQRERFWLDAPAAFGAARRARVGAGEHPLLGASFASSLHPEEQLWEPAELSAAAPWLAEHRLGGESVMPGGAIIELSLAAGAAVFGAGAFELANVRFERMLKLPCGTLQVASAREGGRAALTVASRAEGAAWTRHAVAELREGGAQGARGGGEVAAIRARCGSILPAAEHYARFERIGVAYGPGLRSVERIWLGEGEAIGRVIRSPGLPEDLDAERAYQAHPALLDGALQVMMALALARSPGQTIVPAGFTRARLYRRLPAQVWVYVRGDARGAELTILDDSGACLLEIEGVQLASLPGADDPLDDCVHEVVWRRREPAAELAANPAAASADRRPWIVLGDAGGVGARLARALRERGEACIEAVAGRRPEAELHELLAGACRGVVHCGSLDSARWDETSPATLEADLRRGALAAVELAQAILRRAFRDPPRLVLVTRGAQAAGAGPVAAAQAPVWGFGRALAMEHPELECKQIDLPPTPLADEAELLAREVLAGDAEDQIALRAEGRFVARLVRSRFDVAAGAPAWAGARPVEIAADRTYLITGGLGGLGRSLARWMVEQGARHLVLVGRSAPGASAAREIDALRALGAEVRTAPCDVSRPDEVWRIVREIEAEMPPLRGVVHAAVVVADRTLLELREEHLLATMGPKILGAWNLHAATREVPLDFFVMYSSMASVVGFPGMAAYAVGNAFLDALARARAAEGLPATSVQWGLFADVGVAAQDSRGLRLSARGIESFTPQEGVALFGRVLAHPRAEVALFRISLRRWLESTPQAAGLRYLSELEAHEDARVRPPAAQLRATLVGAAPADRARVLETHVIEELGQVLRIPPARIDRHLPFRNLGLDSLMGLEMRNRLERSLGLRLAATLFFTCPAVSALVEHLLAALALPEPPRDIAGGAGATAVASDDLLAAFDATIRRLDEELLS